jgi:hypothetical protein
MAKGTKKLDIKKAVMRVVVIGGAGAAAQVITEAMGSTNVDIVNYGIVGAGIILPELIKGNDLVSDAADALLAIGAYKLSEQYDLGAKLGITKTVTPVVKGLKNFSAVGDWAPQRTYQANKVNGNKGSEKQGSAIQ